MAAEYGEKYSGYLRIKKLIQDIQIKYTNRYDGKGKEPAYNGPFLLTYEEFKEKMKNKKEDTVPTKTKKVDFYHHLMPEKTALNPSRNMKDLISRKNITLAALKNSRKKHGVEMSELMAKLDFLKDEDAHLTQKIRQKEQDLASMQ